jgi:hypothetical protein
MLDAMRARLLVEPQKLAMRKSVLEHPLGL